MKFEFKRVEFKKAIFTDCQIIIKKRKQNIVIPLNKIDRILYAKCSIKNYLSLGFGDWRVPGGLYIYLKQKINNKKMYCFFIKYDDLIKIPENIFKRIKFYDQYDSWFWMCIYKLDLKYWFLVILRIEFLIHF